MLFRSNALAKGIVSQKAYTQAMRDARVDQLTESNMLTALGNARNELLAPLSKAQVLTVMHANAVKYGIDVMSSGWITLRKWVAEYENLSTAIYKAKVADTEYNAVLELNRASIENLTSMSNDYAFSASILFDSAGLKQVKEQYRQIAIEKAKALASTRASEIGRAHV